MSAIQNDVIRVNIGVAAGGMGCVLRPSETAEFKGREVNIKQKIKGSICCD